MKRMYTRLNDYLIKEDIIIYTHEIFMGQEGAKLEMYKLFNFTFYKKDSDFFKYSKYKELGINILDQLHNNPLFKDILNEYNRINNEIKILDEKTWKWVDEKNAMKLNWLDKLNKNKTNTFYQKRKELEKEITDYRVKVQENQKSLSELNIKFHKTLLKIDPDLLKYYSEKWVFENFKRPGSKLLE